MVVNIIKLGILFIGIIGYFTRSQELGSNKEIQQAEEHHREKRNIYLNSKAPILIAAYITLPISVAFPALKGRSMRSGDYFNASQVPYSYDDPLFQSQLQKIDLYMDYIGIGDDMCRQYFLCEIAASPTTYSPMYSIFKKQLSNSDGIEIKKSYTNRYFRYYNALEEGRRSHHLAESSNNFSDREKDVCRKLFGTCSNDMQDIINLDVLSVMQYLTRKFRVQFADTSMSETTV